MVQGNLFDSIPDPPPPNSHRAAAKRRDCGMKRALDHAQQERSNWCNLVIDGWLVRFLASHAEPFLLEDFREWGETLSDPLPKPPDGRAWGMVSSRADSRGLIVECGTRRAKSSNLSFKVLWRRKSPA